MITTYEVQTYTLCDGWINCWTTYEDDGHSYPTYYDTYAEAEAELSDVLREWPEYMRDEFRIVKVTQ
jgi:hypothetical protein